MQEVESRVEKQQPAETRGIADSVNPLQLLKENRPTENTAPGAEPNELEFNNPFEDAQTGNNNSNEGQDGQPDNSNVGNKDAGTNNSPQQNGENLGDVSARAN